MSNESNFSFTTKINGDLFTVRGDTADEFKANVSAAIVDEVLSHVEALQEAAGVIQPSAAQSGYDLAKQAFNATPAPAANATPPPAPQPAAPKPQPTDGPTCHHGAMTYREGVAGPNAKNPGAPYKMWVCPERDRDRQCKPVWVR